MCEQCKARFQRLRDRIRSIKHYTKEDVGYGVQQAVTASIELEQAIGCTHKERKDARKGSISSK